MEQFYLHICGEAPMVFAINSKQIGWIEREYESIDLLVEKQDFILSSYPIKTTNELGTNISFSARIHFSGGKLVSTHKNIIITDYGKNHFKICAIPFTIPFQNIETPPYYKRFDDYLLSINKNILNFNNSKNSLFYQLPCSLKDIEVKEMFDLFMLTGKTASEKTYALFLNRNLQVEFDGIADKIEYDGTQIITLQEISDIARHGLVTTYKKSNGGFSKFQQYSVYTQNEAVAPASSVAIPWAFMEAINIQNYTLARSYLHPSLSASLQDNHISAYFGEFLEVTPTLDGSLYDLALVYNGNPRFVKIYHFEVNANRIVNIDCIN